MRNTPLIERYSLKVELFDVKGIAVGNSDNGDFGNAVFFVEGKLLLRLDPDTLLAFKGGRDDQLILGGNIAVYPQRFEADAVFDECQRDHAVKLRTERLMGGEVLDKGKVVHDHLLAAAFDGIVDEVEQTLLFKSFDGTVDKIFGDTEVLLGKGVDLMDGHGLCMVAGEDEYERLLVGRELLLKELFHLQRCVLGVSCHGGKGTGFEEMVESN